MAPTAGTGGGGSNTLTPGGLRVGAPAASGPAPPIRAGLALAPTAALATLPVTFWVLGGALATMPASPHMKRVGGQAGLTSGTFWAIAGALICASAIALQSFWLLCFGTLVWGVYNAY